MISEILTFYAQGAIFSASKLLWEGAVSAIDCILFCWQPLRVAVKVEYQNFRISVIHKRGEEMLHQNSNNWPHLAPPSNIWGPPHEFWRPNSFPLLTVSGGWPSSQGLVHVPNHAKCSSCLVRRHLKRISLRVISEILIFYALRLLRAEGNMLWEQFAMRGGGVKIWLRSVLFSALTLQALSTID